MAAYEMSITQAVNLIAEKHGTIVENRAVLVGISGIDASGKGCVTAKLAAELIVRGFNPAVINADGWLNLPNIRFDQNGPARHFYENALRLDEMFEQLILPLKRRRSISLTADLAEETATELHKHQYVFEDIDVILLEGIFLFKRAFVDYFDLKIWVKCSFETALARAVERSQEGLSEAETVAAYENIYIPAQRIHFERDQPRSAADVIIENNPALSSE